MPRVHTWLTRGMPRGGPGPNSAQTRSSSGPCPTLTVYQPPLTGGPVVVNGGPTAVNGGGGWTNGRMTHHRRYCSSSTRGQYEVQKSQYEKLLKDLKELAEYDQFINMDRPIFLNDNHPENSSEENVVSKTNQEPPQDSDTHQLIKECSVEVPEKQKQKMEDTMLELVKIYQEKEFLCIHDDIDNLIESALDSKLLLINSINSQHLDKKEQEVKNIEEQPAGRRNRAEKSLQNFRVVHKSSISVNSTSQISSVHAVAQILSTRKPEHLLKPLPILSKCKVTLEDEIECNMPAKDVCSPVFTTFSNPLFKDNDDLDSSDNESLSDEDVPAEEFKIYLKIPKFDFDFEEEIRHIENLLYSFPRPLEELNAELLIQLSSLFLYYLSPIPVQDGNSQQEEIDIGTETDDVMPPSVENDDDDYDLLLGEADLFLFDNSIPPGIENVADDPEGDIQENPSILRPPLEPPDVESFFDLKPDVIAEEISDKLNEDKCFDPGRERLMFLQRLKMTITLLSCLLSDSFFHISSLDPV
nr:hypothetical protein [Tanacetum cinerariifolium]